VAVVADVHADLAEARLEDGVAEVAGLEVELLPEARVAVGDVVLAVLAEVLAGVVDHRGGVVVDAGHVELVDRDDHDHAVDAWRCSCMSLIVGPSGIGSAVSYQRVVLLGAEVGAVEDLLQAAHLGALAPRPDRLMRATCFSAARSSPS
jgi:hypothetical protein